MLSAPRSGQVPFLSSGSQAKGHQLLLSLCTRSPTPVHFPPRTPSPAPSKWCNQRQLFKLGERSPPSLYPASGGGGRGRVENLLAGPQNPGHLAECWGLHLQPLPCAINTGQGLRAPAFLGLSLLSFPGLFCSSPISCAFPTPSPIIIRGNFRARKGASSSLGLTPIPYPEGVGTRDILQVFPWWGWFSLDHLPV